MAEKVLLIKLKTTVDGTPAIAGFGRTLDEVAASENRVQREMHETAAAARVQDGALASATSTLKGWLAAAGGLAAAGALFRQVFTYNQDVESTTNAIAGLYFANNKYVDSLGNAVDESAAYAAATAEARAEIAKLQIESLKTAATVPQIGKAYATTFGAVAAAGIRAANEEILQLTVRLTQAGNAFEVPMEQMRQEINSLLTGQVTEDSIIAKRLGLDNKSIKELIANGKLVEEIIRRTDAYALAAEAQSNTVRGKLVNTAEAIVATLSRAFDSSIQGSKSVLDNINNSITDNGQAIEEWTGRAIAGVSRLVDRVVQLYRENENLISSVLGLGAALLVVKGSIDLINTALLIAQGRSMKFFVTMIAIVAAWEGMRQLAPLEIGGNTVGGYFSSLATFLFGLIGNVGMLLFNAVRLLTSGIRTLVSEAFEQLGAGMRRFGELSGLDGWAEMGRSVEQFFGQWSIGSGKFSQTVANFTESTQSMWDAMIDGANNALEETKELPSIGDMAKDAVAAAIDAVKGMLPEAEQTGSKLADALSGVKGERKAAPAKTDDKLLAKLEKEKLEYLNFIDQFRAAASAAGDPLSQALAKIEVDRAAAIRKLEEQRKQLKGAVGIDFDADKKSVNKFFDDRALEAAADSLRQINDLTLREQRALYTLTTEIAVDAQERATESRINLIANEIEREKQMRYASNDAWLAEKVRSIGREITNEKTKETMIAAVRAEWRQRNEEADVEAQRRIRERTIGTAEYWKKLGEEMQTQFRGIGQIVADSILDARASLASGLNSFLDDWLDGEASLIDSLADMSKGLARIWTKNFTDILMNGKNVFAQLQGLWKQMDPVGNPMTNSGPGAMDRGLAGAGMGGMIGGFMQKPGNHAQLGGMIGGGIGALFGPWFGALGAVLGTFIGSLIQKGKDSIRVAIVDGVATVTEKGISAQARMEVETQIQRKVRDEMKAWRGIFDLFPEHVRAELERLKLLNPSLNLEGGIEDADITDQGALNALQDFLGNDLPKATFDAYRGGIEKGLDLMGVGAQRMRELFLHWGTLQGHELQEAVRAYITTMVAAVEIRDKFKAPFQSRWDEASKRNSMTALGQIDDVDAKIQMAVASMAKLTDIDDLIAAQQQINTLANQRYEMEIAHIQRILQLQEQLSASIAGQKEQIQLAGMGDQEKVNFFFQRMLDLRGQLGAATDPEEISRLTQQIQAYVSQALGMAPDNKEMRDKLLAILDDVDTISQERLGAAIEDVKARETKPAEALTTAAELLMKAAQDISGAFKPGPPPQPPGTIGDGGTGGGGNRPRVPHDIERKDGDSDLLRVAIGEVDAISRAIAQRDADPQLAKGLTDDLVRRIGTAMRSDIASVDDENQLAQAIGSQTESLARAIAARGGDRTELLKEEIADELLGGLRDTISMAIARDKGSPLSDAGEKREQLRDVLNAAIAAMPASKPDDVGAAVKKALSGATFVFDEPLIIDNGELGRGLVENAKREVILALKDDPYIAVPRAR